MTTLTVRLPDSLAQAARDQAAAEDLTLSQLVRRLIRDHCRVSYPVIPSNTQ